MILEALIYGSAILAAINYVLDVAARHVTRKHFTPERLAGRNED